MTLEALVVYLNVRPLTPVEQLPMHDYKAGTCNTTSVLLNCCVLANATLSAFPQIQLSAIQNELDAQLLGAIR